MFDSSQVVDGSEVLGVAMGSYFVDSAVPSIAEFNERRSKDDECASSRVELFDADRPETGCRF